MSINENSIRELFRSFAGLHPAFIKFIPVFNDLSALTGATELRGSDGIITRRLERRHRRIHFVQDELGKLDFKQAKPGENLEDFVFSHTDFSVYRNISAEDFRLFDEGLEDFEDRFFVQAFNLQRRDVIGLIRRGYSNKSKGGYTINRENPLLLSVMRSLHTSLDFAPLITQTEVNGEWQKLLNLLIASYGSPANRPLPPEEELLARLYATLLALLDGVTVKHRDGAKTELRAETVNQNNSARIILKGIFHPRGRPYTINLASSPVY
ncbi:hypothetical protein FACS1894151_02900 [Spirochaetia bacterium]|nr:hypothetical protein FACS1894151_02900 [Spirochaetia bacterium]